MRFLDGFRLFFNPAWVASNVFTLYGDLFGGSAPAAPDYTPIATANAESAKLASDSAANDLAFRKEQYTNSIPYQKQLYDLSSQVAQQQLAASKSQQGLADQQTASYNSTYRPMEFQTALDSLGANYLSDEDVAQAKGLMSNPNYSTGDNAVALNALTRKAANNAANQATTQADAESANAVGQATRSAQRMGLNPARLTANLAATAPQEALTSVNAANTARNNVTNAGAGLRIGVANFGRNMPNTSNQSVATATNSGNSAVGNQSTGFNSGLTYPNYVSGGTQNAISAAGLGINANLGLGGLMSNTYGNQLNYASQQGSGLGGFLGTVVGAGTGSGGMLTKLAGF